MAVRYNRHREAIEVRYRRVGRPARLGRTEGEGVAVSQPPEVLAMVLCDMIITDSESNKKSLIGLFDRVESPAMPCLVNELHVYVCLTDGHGSLPVSIACIAAEEGDELFRGHAEVEFLDPLQVVELHFVFPHAQFPRAGEYRFQFYADGVLLRERKFFVSFVRDEPKQDEC
jgi:hypothetical protein